MKNGRFIVLDGPDGCGKSTQAKLLFNALSRKYPERKIIATREPGGTAAGEEIRNILLKHYSDGSSLFAETEVYLFFAARAQLAREVISPALNEGKIIICERWVSATLAYQGYAGKIPVENVIRTGALAIGDFEPDLLVILDVETEEGIKRIGRKADRIEAKSLAYHRSVRLGFHEIVKNFKHAILIPPGTIEETHRRVFEEVERVIR